MKHVGALEGSVTLDAVLTAVAARRVPIAPELAGYLALEVAEASSGRDAAGLDAKQVYITDEGTVAVVTRGSREGDAEQSLREWLAQLLDVSGSPPAALGAAAKRRLQGNSARLVGELEAALIPVNRGAGRRALGRLAREVKRVTLGIGRNAQSVPPQRLAEPVAEPHNNPSSTHASAEQARRAIADSEPAASARQEAVTGAGPSATPEPLHAHTAGEPAEAAEGAEPAALPLAVLRAEPEPAEPAEPAEPEVDEVDQLLANFQLSDAPNPHAAAQSLKRIAGLAPTPAPPEASEVATLVKAKAAPSSLRAASAEADPVADLLALSAAPADAQPVARVVPVAEPPQRQVARAASAPERLPAPGSAAAAPLSARTAQLRAPAPRSAEVPPEPIEPAARSGAANALRVVLIALLLAAVVLGAAWWLRPDWFGAARSGELPAAGSSNSAAPKTAPSCRATLTVRGAPADAEVLLLMGQAPLEMERLPVGARIELIALADGYAPRRIIVPSDAAWERPPAGRPRLDIPVELSKSKAKPGSVDAWPPAEPGAAIGGKGEPGTLHVLSSPRGAEVWLLAGLGAEAQFEPLACDKDLELLIATPGGLRKRIKRTSAELRAGRLDGQGQLKVDVQVE